MNPAYVHDKPAGNYHLRRKMVIHTGCSQVADQQTEHIPYVIVNYKGHIFTTHSLQRMHVDPGVV